MAAAAAALDDVEVAGDRRLCNSPTDRHHMLCLCKAKDGRKGQGKKRTMMMMMLSERILVTVCCCDGKFEGGDARKSTPPK
jgi:hypothetical protein